MKRMKKWMILAAAVVLAAPVFAQTQEAFPSYIQVNGRSQMEVTPDEFYLSIPLVLADAAVIMGLEVGQLAVHRQILFAAPFGGRSR